MGASRGPLEIGVAGLGGFGRQHLATWSAIPTARLAALCDVDSSALNRQGDRYGVAKRFQAYGELLADPSIDAVDIVTPAHLHAEQALAALAAGKHVFCEKPLAESAGTAQGVVDAARTAGLRL